MKRDRPARFIARLLALLVPADERGQSILGDLHEEWLARAHSSAWRADLWYAWDALGVAARYGLPEAKRRLKAWTWLALPDAVLQDQRFAWRMLRARPAFALISIGTLGLGIGVTTFVFSAMNALLLTPPPVSDPDRLVIVQESRSGPNNSSSMGQTNYTYDRYLSYREAVSGTLDLAAQKYEQFSLRAEGGAKLLTGVVASGNYFEVLGVRPFLGRFFTRDLDRRGAEEAVVVLGYRYWQREFGGDRGVIGSTLHIDGRSATVIGVAPEGFGGAIVPVFLPDVWVPAALYRLPSSSAEGGATAPRQFWMNFVARLAPGISLSQAAAAVAVIGPRVPTEDARTRILKVSLDPLPNLPGVGGQVFGFMSLQLIAALLVLLIVVTNVAGMLLAQATARRRELAIRMAVGAGRARIIRQLLSESLLLCVLGGSAGLLLAFGAARAFAAIQVPVTAPVSLDLPINGRVFAFTTLLVLGTSLLLGLSPALQALAPDLLSALKQGLGSVRRTRLRNVLVILQFAASLVLLVASGLFLRTLRNALTVDPGFDARGVVMAQLGVEALGYNSERSAALMSKLLQNVEASPEIESATRALFGPLSQNQNHNRARLPQQSDDQGMFVQEGRVDPDYFVTMRTPLLAGRSFTEVEATSGPPPIVINETLARRFWPNGGALGQPLMLAGVERVVVGIARDGKYNSLGERPRPYAFIPLSRSNTSALLYVRARGAAQNALTVLRRELAALEPDIALEDPKTLDDHLNTMLLPQRVGVWLLSAFGLAGLLLAAIGIYGVLSYYVAQRTREFGLRLALGARRTHVITPVLREGVVLLGIGALLGLGAALAVGRLAARFLFGVRSFDVITFLLATTLLAVIALLASYLPARRAARIDPLVAMRSE